MSDFFLPQRNYGFGEAPGPQRVLLDAAVKVELGKMTVRVSGYGQLPAAANAATGKMAGVNLSAVDNTLGAQGALEVTCTSGVYNFSNDGTHPCTVADEGTTVYASGPTTISRNSGDGPPAGTLVKFDSSDPQGRPCRVALKCVQ